MLALFKLSNYKSSKCIFVCGKIITEDQQNAYQIPYGDNLVLP